jgi:2-haloacid dehalogenase
MKTVPSIAVFDLGGVLVDWNPRYLYRKLFDGDEDAMEHFLATVCTGSWNAEQDAGRTFAEGCESLRTTHPLHANLIDAWVERFDEMMAGSIAGTVDLLKELRSDRVQLYALSNWSAATFPARAETVRIPAVVSRSAHLRQREAGQARSAHISALS